MGRRVLAVSVIAAAIVGLAVVVVALGQGSASAQPIGAATYSGTVSPGGSVSLTISADGTEVTQISYTISAGTCASAAAASGLAVAIENDAFVWETSNASFSGSFPSPGSAEGTIETTASAPCDSATWSATTSATPVPSPTPTPSPTPAVTPTPGQMHGCPQAGKWSIATWAGQDATPISEALASCSQQVDVAYHINPETQAWTRYFRDRPEISNLTALDDCQGVIALSSSVSAALSPRDERLEAAANANGMVGCPLQGKWAIAVWDGDDGTDAEQALATCGEDAVAVAYSIDAQTQGWSRWFADRPEMSNLGPFGYMQGVLALGGAGAGATATPSPTPTPTPTPAPTPTATPAAAGGSPTDYLDTFHGALDMSMDMEGIEMVFAIEGDFEAPSRCSCDISASMWGMPLIEERVILMGREAWIDTGDGWHETTPSDPEVVGVAAMCPACPSFWEGFAFEAPPLVGEHETKNGVAAIRYSFAEFYEAFAGIGLIPEEMEGVSVETFDIWVAEEDKWLVCLDMEMCVDAEAMEEFTGSLPELESLCMTMGIDITRVNDPRIQVKAP